MRDGEKRTRKGKKEIGEGERETERRLAGTKVSLANNVLQRTLMFQD